MKCYLLQAKIKGIKNIDKEITLNFYNQTLKKTFELNKSNIKAIYGKNGSGKSAIMNAIDIYKNLVLDIDYLSNVNYHNILNEIINKSINKFSIEITYLFYAKNNNERMKTYTHQIELSKNNFNRFFISHELLFNNASRKYDMSKGQIVVETKNGKLECINSDDDISDFLESTNNLYDKSSVTSLVLHYFKSNEFKNDIFNKEVFLNLFSPFAFATNLKIILSDSDTHKEYLIDKIINDKYGDKDSIIESYLDGFISISNNKFNSTKDFVLKSNFERYIKNVKQLEKFIKIFKTSLNEIIIEKIEDKNAYVCRKIFKYENYQVDSEFESTGIKKLISYYNAFCDLNNGMIVFIDELDANLHDVYLCKLIEYFCEFSQGQLCFTTHNLAPMEILKKRNYAIDFLSDDSQITSWIKNGNYSVTKLYKEGMIDNSPFNINSFDFLGLFEE